MNPFLLVLYKVLYAVKVFYEIERYERITEIGVKELLKAIEILSNEF